MLSPAAVVLHTGHSVTLGEYLVRVLVHLLAVAGIGVTLFWSFRVIRIVQSGIGGREETTGDSP